MLYYDRNDIREGVDPTKSNKIKKSMIWHYWIFNHGFKFHDSVCNGCHGLTVLCLNKSNFAIVTVKDINYCWIIHNISKSKAIKLLKHSVLDDRAYI